MNLCQCGNNFTSLTYFDQHQSGIDPVTCKIPDSWEQDYTGAWFDPAQRQATRDAFATRTPNGPKVLTCKACGTIWEQPRSRGRYPSKCKDCK